MSALLSLKDAFMQSTEWERSFLLLDDICNALIERKNDPEFPFAIDPALIAKVGEIDSRCEKDSARSIIAETGGRENLSRYPWLLYDYYKAEFDFFKSYADKDLKQIACFGHGAIPSLALVILEQYPDIEIDMFDIDENASQLAQALMKKLYPDARLNFQLADAQNFNTDKEYDAIAVTNAAMPYYMERQTPLNSEYLFIRSATNRGNFVYPRADTEKLPGQGYDVKAHAEDRIYGIHEWIVAQRAP